MITRSPTLSLRLRRMLAQRAVALLLPGRVAIRSSSGRRRRDVPGSRVARWRTKAGQSAADQAVRTWFSVAVIMANATFCHRFSSHASRKNHPLDPSPVKRSSSGGMGTRYRRPTRTSLIGNSPCLARAYAFVRLIPRIEAAVSTVVVSPRQRTDSRVQVRGAGVAPPRGRMGWRSDVMSSSLS